MTLIPSLLVTLNVVAILTRAFSSFPPGISFLTDLFLDHNEFVGTLPESYITVGNGRLESLAINDNFLTGQVPDNHVMFNKLVMFTMENNDFNVALRDTCKLDVFEGGEAVEVKADCDICSCDKGVACTNC